MRGADSFVTPTNHTLWGNSMTAATSPREVTRARSNRSRATHDGADELPVLLRLPNLRADSPSTAKTSSKDKAQKIGPDEHNSNNSGRRKGGSKTESQERPTVQPKSKQSQILGLLWRVGIVAAAIALIVLAYRIINGPPAPAHVEVPDDTAMPSITLTDESQPVPETGEESVVSNPPTIVTPRLTFSEATPISEAGSSAGSETGRTADSVTPDSSVATGDPEESGEGLVSTPSWNDEAASSWREDQTTSSWADDEQLTSSGADNSWQIDSDQSQSGYPSTSNYPESDRTNWRTAQQWFLAAEQAAQQEEQTAPAWHDEERSASRLRPNIQQPPLPRDSLR